MPATTPPGPALLNLTVDRADAEEHLSDLYGHDPSAISDDDKRADAAYEGLFHATGLSGIDVELLAHDDLEDAYVDAFWEASTWQEAAHALDVYVTGALLRYVAPHVDAATAASGEPYTAERFVREALEANHNSAPLAHAWISETIDSL